MMDSLDVNNPVIQLCLAGSQAELARQIAAASTLYQQAWAAAHDDYEACIAAHYVARCQTTPQAMLHWNLVALEHAQAVADERVQDFYPSLYVCLGQAYESLGQMREARRYYGLAAMLGLVHQPTP